MGLGGASVTATKISKISMILVVILFVVVVVSGIVLALEMVKSNDMNHDLDNINSQIQSKRQLLNQQTSV